MTGEELYRLGKESPAAVACIPLNFIPTVPKLAFDNGWQLEFWYYMFQYHDQSVFAPQYHMVLRFPSAIPVQMQELSDTSVCIGSAPEIVTVAFCEKQNGYLDRCAAAVEKDMSLPGEPEELETVWRQTLPACLGTWFDKGGKLWNDMLPPPKNLRAYWERELAEAIRCDNTERILNAQQELQKAVRNAGLGT